MARLIRGVARTAMIAGTATAVSNRVSRRQAERWADQDNQRMGEPVYTQPAPAPVAAVTSTDDKLAQLKQLGELKTAGILTDAEFEQQKAKILAQ